VNPGKKRPIKSLLWQDSSKKDFFFQWRCTQNERLSEHSAIAILKMPLSFTVFQIATFPHSPIIYGNRVETYEPYSRDYMRAIELTTPS